MGGIDIKKFELILMLVFGVFLGYLLIPIFSQELNINDVINTQKQLNQYKQQEHENKLKELELQSIHNQELVLKEFNKIGKLLVYQGGIVYKDELFDEGWISKRELDLYLKYDYGIVIDLKEIEIKQIVGDAIVLSINKNSLEIEYIELNLNETHVKSNTTWLTKNYSPEEVKMILGLAHDKVVDLVKENDQIFNAAYNSGKNEIEKLLKSLGFKTVVFE